MELHTYGMTSNASAFESSKQNSVAIEHGVRHPTALRGRRRDTALRAPTAYDRTFFQRVAYANAVQANLMRSSAIKLEESLKLLAEVSDLLRR